MKSDVHTLFMTQANPTGGYKSRFEMHPYEAWKLWSAASNFGSRMLHTIRGVSSLISIATDEDEGCAPSSDLISECTWGLSGLAELVWAADLSYGGYDDWRLADINPQGTDFNLLYSTDGSTDFGYNISSTASELGYMFYVNLGLEGYYDETGADNSAWFDVSHLQEISNSAVNDGSLSIDNLLSYIYWSEGVDPLSTEPDHAWLLSTRYGYQVDGPASGEYLAWAVRDGDIANVPEPATLALMGLGLAGIGYRRHRSKKAD